MSGRTTAARSTALEEGRVAVRGRTITAGLLGIGRIGEVHAANLLRMPGVSLAAIADPILREPAVRARIAALAGGGVELLDDPAALLAEPRIEAVCICTPTFTHADLLEAAAAAGKHVFCEKPIDLEPERIVGSLATVESAGIRLQVGFNRRFDPSFRRLRAGIVLGEIGRLHLLRITSRDPSPPPATYRRSSGGLFLDMTIHDFDMVRYLSGSEVVEVHAFAEALVDPGLEDDVDTAVVAMRLSCGALALIDNSRRAVYGYDQRLEALGHDGCLEARNQRQTTTLLHAPDGEHASKPHPFFLERYGEAFRAELEEFFAAVRENREPPVSGHDGLMAVLVARAARRSLASGRPVEVS